MSAASDVSRRAAAFVRHLGASLAAAGTHSAADAAAVRTHVAAVIEGLPTPTEQHKAMRSYLLESAHFEEAVRSITQAISSKTAAGVDAQKATAAPLFSHAAYSAALADIDQKLSSEPRAAAGLQSYMPLLLPSASPSFVRSHLLRTLIAQAKSLSAGRGGASSQQTQAQAQHLGANVAAFLGQGHVMDALAMPLSPPASAECQHQIELQLRFVRALPMHHASCAAIAALIDRACAHLSSAAAVAASLSISTARRYQFLLASLLLEEAKRRSHDSWSQAESQRTFVSRVRTVLRCIPHPQPFTVSLAGQLMFLQLAFDGLKEFKAAEKAHRPTKRPAAATSAAASSSSSKRSRSRSGSPSLSAGSFHDIPFFHTATFSALWHPLLADILGALGAGGRKEGDVETELLRLAILVRSVASTTLPAALHSLQSSTVAAAAAFPSRPIPLSLRPALQRFGSGSSAVTQCGQLWSARTEASSKVAQLSVAQLTRVLIELEGNVGIDEEDDAKQHAVTAEDSDDESAGDDDAAEASSSNKKARFDEFGVSRKADAMFFLDSGDASAAGGAPSSSAADDAAASGATTASADGDSDPASSRSVEASMSRILKSLPQSEPTASTQLSKKQRAAAEKAAAASTAKAAEDLTNSQQQPIEEGQETGAAPMELEDGNEDAQEAKEEEEAAPASKRKQRKSAAAKKSAAKSTKAKKEPEEAAPAESAPTRSKRTAKSKRGD